VAATVLAAVILIVLWYGNSSKAIAWADVQEQLKQVHTMIVIAHIEISNNEGARISELFEKLYYQDPGLSRVELYASEADIDTGKSRLKMVAKIFSCKKDPVSRRRSNMENIF
jgi:hypothetical protein